MTEAAEWELADRVTPRTRGPLARDSLLAQIADDIRRANDKPKDGKDLAWAKKILERDAENIRLSRPRQSPTVRLFAQQALGLAK